MGASRSFRASYFSEGRGRGATLMVKLPVIEAETGMERRAAPESQRVSRRILLVEDNRDTGILMKKILDRDGHAVHFAHDVASALQVAEKERFDLLLCDIGLPDGSGLDVVRSLRQQGAIDNAIAMTGFGRAEDLEQCREAGFDTHLTKPVDIEDLRGLIGALPSRAKESLPASQ